MKLKHLLLAALGIAAITFAASCKKDNTKQLDKALLNGQWLAGYLVVNNAPQDYFPYTLFDIDADNGKASVFRYYGDDIPNSPLTIEDRTLTIKKGSISLEYEVLSLDAKHMILRLIDGDYVVDYHLFNMSRLISNDWSITWDYEGGGTQYFLLNADGTGYMHADNGTKQADLTWWIEPAINAGFRFTIKLPDSYNWENTFTIWAIRGDEQLKGLDEKEYTIYMNGPNIIK